MKIAKLDIWARKVLGKLFEGVEYSHGHWRRRANKKIMYSADG